MSPLDKLHRKLYSHNAKDLEQRGRSQDSYDWSKSLLEEESQQDEKGKTADKSNPEKEEAKDAKENDLNSRQNNKEEVAPQSSLEKPEEEGMGKMFKYALIVLGALIIIVGGFYFYVRYKQASFDQEKVEIEYEGDKNIKSGERTSVVLNIKNQNRTSLEKTQLKVSYPDEFKPLQEDFMEEAGSNSFKINPGKIEGYESKQYKLEFDVYMPKGNQVYLDSVLTYEPSNFSSFFEEKNYYAVDVEDSVLDFSLVSEREVAKGELAILRFILENKGNRNLKNLKLNLNAPENFKIQESDFQESEGEVFEIGAIDAGEEKVFELKGSLEGQEEEIKNFIATIEEAQKEELLTLTDDDEAIKIIPPRVDLKQNIANKEELIADPGEFIDYEISFTNNSGKPLTDLILKQNINNTGIINEKEINPGDGYYDGEKKQIVWKASDVPDLKYLNPGETGSVSVDIPVRDDYEIWDEEDKNITFSTQAQIDSLNIQSDLVENKTIYSQEKEFKVSTQLDLDVNIAHESDIFENKGPFPVNKQEETEFTVNVKVNNSYNNTRDFRAYLTLPTGVNWKDNFKKTRGEVDFNERTNELSWTIDSVDFATGHLNSPEELSFQIGFRLSEAQRQSSSRSIRLINNLDYQGIDSFIDRKIEESVDSFQLELINVNN